MPQYSYIDDKRGEIMEPAMHADDNRQTYQRLSEMVIGHDNAKKVLINLFNRSYLRYYQRYGLLLADEELVPTANCLLIGDSGTGKTHLVESLAKIKNAPLLKIDATELNPTGASGGVKKSDLVSKIYKCAKNAMEDDPETYFSLEGTLSRVICFVDEVDKLAQKLSSDWNAHVQANFLAMFENKSELDSVSFIFAGAFTGMEKHSVKSTKLGFNHQKDEDVKHKDMSQEIIKYGLIPELVGRLNNVVKLDQLRPQDYYEILETIILPKTAGLLAYYGIYDYNMRQAQKDKLVDEAVKSGLGVRSLQAGVNKVLVELEFDPESYIFEESLK